MCFHCRTNVRFKSCPRKREHDWSVFTEKVKCRKIKPTIEIHIVFSFSSTLVQSVYSQKLDKKRLPFVAFLRQIYVKLYLCYLSIWEFFKYISCIWHLFSILYDRILSLKEHRWGHDLKLQDFVITNWYSYIIGMKSSRYKREKLTRSTLALVL